MSDSDIVLTGGCLCGKVRFQANGAPLFAGYCCCTDCRKASGSGYMPYMGYRASALTVTGETREIRSPSDKGTEAVRNFCPNCGSIVLGGQRGKDKVLTVYAGTLDDAAQFKPTHAIFNRSRPHWVPLPPDIAVHEVMPG